MLLNLVFYRAVCATYGRTLTVSAIAAITFRIITICILLRSHPRSNRVEGNGALQTFSLHGAGDLI